MSIAIERNVPLPTAGRKYPVAELGVGHSFFVANGNKSSIMAVVSRYKRAHAGSDYTCRVVDGGIRVWRLA